MVEKPLDRESCLQRISIITGVERLPGLPLTLSKKQVIAVWMNLSGEEASLDWVDQPITVFREKILNSLGDTDGDASIPLSLPVLRKIIDILEG